MKTRTRLLLGGGIAVLLAGLSIGVYFVLNPVETTLEFTIRDSVSRRWVWDATVRLQDRVIRAYYQSDESPSPFVFTNLSPGEAELTVEAPGYSPVTVPVDLRRGANALEQPVDLTGYEIPDLWQWVVVEERLGTDIVQEYRPVGRNGRAISDHPCVDLWILARVSVQVRDGVPIRQPTEAGSQRGTELFRGLLPWEFDADPETTFRYSSRIPGEAIGATNSPLWVIDYLIIVPDPRETDRDEIEEIMEEVLELPLEGVESYLAPYEEEGVLTPYIYTSWNVEGGLR